MRRLIILLLLVTATAASAAAPPLGVRGGYTNWEGESQVHLGGHARIGDIFPNVAFTPGLEVGFGSGLKVWSFNGDLYYRATEYSQKHFQPYVGGSVALIHVAGGPGNGTDLGLSALLGTAYALENGNELLGEIRLGLVDAPGFKLTVGITFF